MAAVVLLSQLYNRPVHICHVAKREEVGVAESGRGYKYSDYIYIHNFYRSY